MTWTRGILLAVVVLLACAGGYYFYSSSGTKPADSTLKANVEALDDPRTASAARAELAKDPAAATKYIVDRDFASHDLKVVDKGSRQIYSIGGTVAMMTPYRTDSRATVAENARRWVDSFDNEAFAKARFDSAANIATMKASEAKLEKRVGELPTKTWVTGAIEESATKADGKLKVAIEATEARVDARAAAHLEAVKAELEQRLQELATARTELRRSIAVQYTDRANAFRRKVESLAGDVAELKAQLSELKKPAPARAYDPCCR